MANQNNPQQQPNKPNAPRGKRPWWSKLLYIVYIGIMLALIWGLFGGGGGSASKQPITWERLEPIL